MGFLDTDNDLDDSCPTPDQRPLVGGAPRPAGRLRRPHSPTATMELPGTASRVRYAATRP